MGNKRGPERIRQRGDGAGAGGGRVGGRTEELRRSFEEFRREHRLRARIPQGLRDAALAALHSGTPAVEVRRACRISAGQLDRWLECRRERGQRLESDEAEPRVFPVVDDVSGNAAGVASGHESGELHLRVGGWEICVRQVEG
jgi:hypothetical protein